jgi:hypothetical protein
MERTKKLQDFVDGVAKKKFGRSLTEALEQNICVYCGKPATEFKDALSKKEYDISGMCQVCQDEIFEGED